MSMAFKSSRISDVCTAEYHFAQAFKGLIERHSECARLYKEPAPASEDTLSIVTFDINAMLVDILPDDALVALCRDVEKRLNADLFDGTIFNIEVGVMHHIYGSGAGKLYKVIAKFEALVPQ